MARKKMSKKQSRKPPKKPKRPAAAKPTRRATSRPAAARRTHDGSCHCGAIEFSYETALAPGRWSLRRCQCSFCRSHGATVTSDAGGLVRFSYVHPDRLRRYRHALRTADFLVCRGCGVYVAAVLLTGAGAVAAVNVNTLRELPRGLARARTVNYTGESAEERRGRRAAGWTPVFGPV